MAIYGPPRRKRKRRISKLFKELGKKRYFEDCNYHTCKMTSRMMYRSRQDGDLDGISLFTNQGTSCSLSHCSPLPLTEKEAMERLDYFNGHGFDNYLRKYVYKPVSDDEWTTALAKMQEFRNVWRGGKI